MESLKMTEQFLCKTAGFTECLPDTMSLAAIIPLYANGQNFRIGCISNYRARHPAG
jgi:hypothetical protein